MDLPEFARAYPSTVNLETIGLINGVAASQTFPRGELAKRVVEAGCRSRTAAQSACVSARQSRAP